MRFGRNSFLKTSISTRIAILFSITFTSSILLAFLISYYQIADHLKKTSKEVVASKFHEDAAILSAHGIEGLREFLNTEANRAMNAPFLIQVLDTNGNTLFVKPSVQKQNFDFPSALEKATDMKTVLGWHALPAVDDEDQFDMYGEHAGSGLILIVGKSSEDREALLTKLIDVFGITALIFALLSGAIGIISARSILSPLRDLLNTIKEIETGDLSRRVLVDNSSGELHDLGETFNRMVMRIERLVSVMKESIDNVAHDIRTPLTRIKIVAEDALISENPEKLSIALEDCAEGATQISELVEQLLSISEADAGTLKLKYEITSLYPLLTSVIEIYEFVAQAKDIQLEISCEPIDLIWNFDRKRISQAIGNLIDNAIKFSPEKTTIYVSARIIKNYLCLQIRDSGPGIPEQDLPKIWDRLFRSDKSRSTPGLGLGLSIVQAVVMAHGGNTEALANADRGMSFYIKLPNS